MENIFAGTYECAVDFGGSATKLAFRQVGKLNWNHLKPVPNEEIWSDPNTAATLIIDLLVQEGATRIEALGISMSADISPAQIITASDRLLELNPQAYSQLFSQGGFNLRASIQGFLLPGACCVGVVNDGVAAAIGVAVHPNNSTARGPVLVVTLGSNPAISIVQQQVSNMEVIPPDVTLFSNVTIGTSDGLKALHAPGGVRGEDLESLGKHRKSSRIGRAVAAILSDPMHGYLKKYSYLPIGGIYLMGGNTCGLDDTLLQQSLLQSLQLTPEVQQAWREKIIENLGSFRDEVGNHPNGPPYILSFGEYRDQSGVHLNGALHFFSQI
jgi:hypothetical protein